MPFPLIGSGEVSSTLLMASYSRTEVTVSVLSTDARAPSTSILWYLHSP